MHIDITFGWPVTPVKPVLHGISLWPAGTARSIATGVSGGCQRFLCSFAGKIAMALPTAGMWSQYKINVDNAVFYYLV